MEKDLNSFKALQPRRTPVSWNQDPAILSVICEHLSVPDLCRVACVSKRFKNAAYKESHWLRRLRNIHLIPQDYQEGDQLSEEEKGSEKDSSLINDIPSASPLDALDTFQFKPGKAREGYMHLFRVYAPLYFDILDSGRNKEPEIFKIYREPQQQAKVLSHIKLFAESDDLENNHEENLASIHTMLDLFENAALGEFEQGYDEKDILGRVKEYAGVLVILNGGESCVQLLIQKHPLVSGERLPEGGGDTKYFFNNGVLDKEKLQHYLQSIADSLNAQTGDIDNVFPPTIPVMLPLFEKILEDNIMELFSSMIDYAKEVDQQLYLNTVPELYVHLKWFTTILKPCNNTGPDYIEHISTIIDESMGLAAENYFSAEFQYFSDKCDEEIAKWNKTSADHEAATETFLWSNVSKEKDKSDFLSSFKKVLMMPVSVIPFSGSTAEGSTNNIKHDIKPVAEDTTAEKPGAITSPTSSLPPDSVTGTNNNSTASLPLPQTPPTTELDAMMAVMNNKLAGIKTLFSLELALSLIRLGRDAIERIGKFAVMENRTASDAKVQCEAIFVELVRQVGSKHVRDGFDKAINTLNKYNPQKFRQTITEKTSDGEEHNAVEPLAIFAELVNIGDLIQQMIHVFFEEELCLKQYIDRTDFLSPAVKAKKRFEQSLDDSVANGLNRGIDVLIDQIDFVLITQQLGSDFNPMPVDPASGYNNNNGGLIDIGPTEASKQVVSLLSSHVKLLAGSTEKSVIDVFQQEIGVRFFHSLCKHIKRQTISAEGSIKLISDLNYYYDFVASLKQKEIMPYFEALKEVGHLFLIDGTDAKELGKTLSDMTRFRGVLQPEEVYEFVQCRADWFQVKREVEKVMYGFGVECMMM